MNRIELSQKTIVSPNRNSSKGNQLKWFDDGIWYKADNLGYEALSEYLVSHLLHKTNVYESVLYDICRISYQGKDLVGCSSKNFLKQNESLITLPRLFEAYFHEDIFGECERLDRTEQDCAEYICQRIHEATGIKDFGKYMTFVLEMDALFLNEDRHFHNFAVIHDETKNIWRLAPIFDSGASLFSDTKSDYSINEPLEKCFELISAKPLSPSFDDQVDALRQLYGPQFRFWFDMNDVDKLLKNVEGYYSHEVIDRVREIMNIQIQKYQEMRISEPLDNIIGNNQSTSESPIPEYNLLLSHNCELAERDD